MPQSLTEVVGALHEGPGDGGDHQHQAGNQRNLRHSPAAAAHELAVVDGDAHVTLTDVESVLGESRQQCFVGEDVYAPREPFGRLRHAPVGATAKYVGAAVADGAHAEIHILAHLLGGEGLQVETMGDALVELADFRLAEVVIELRLTE